MQKNYLTLEIEDTFFRNISHFSEGNTPFSNCILANSFATQKIGLHYA